MALQCLPDFDFNYINSHLINKTKDFYENKFSEYNFELDHFQKYAIVGIEETKHILITAHTGSGKTLPAEYAIEKTVNDGKKIIYTSPIKSLSNQKYNEFTKKFPNISFGILTGDIKFNPEADCVIMTTEVLRNIISVKNTTTTSSNLSFDVNIDDIGCVIFDEVHYINDANRGKVWEECIMNIPNNIQMVMLSATIDKELEFANWITEIKNKQVWIASTKKRAVPLNHYMFYTTNSSFDKSISKDKNPSIIKNIKNNYTDKLISYNNEDTYNHFSKLENFTNKFHLRPHKQHVIHNIITLIKNKNMLPAICFVFSRKQIEQYASFIQFSLFDSDNEYKSNIIDNECKKILMKFPNYKEYINLPEYSTIVNFLKKGIAIHHSGILPIFREMIELMFSKGFVQLLFATETFAVGINMPTKTVLFTSLSKFSDNSFRYLLPHEYTQMAGRAGRRGLDTIGHVIHLNNLFELPNKFEYTKLMSGTPQTLKSKFDITPQLILNCLKEKQIIQNNSQNSIDFIFQYVENTMSKKENHSLLSGLYNVKTELQVKYDNIINTFKFRNININDLEEYTRLQNSISRLKPKKQKTSKRIMNGIFNKYSRNFDEQLKIYDNLIKIQSNIQDINNQIDDTKELFKDTIKNILNTLQNGDFIDEDYKLYKKGIIASYINEINPFIIANIIDSKILNKYSVTDFIIYISFFIELKNSSNRETTDYLLSNYKELYDNTIKYIDNFVDLYNNNNLSYSEDEIILYTDNIDLVYKWCNATTEEETKVIFNICKKNDIFIGDFVKFLLKIVNISNEIKMISSNIGDIQLEHLCSQVEEKLLKFVATNQSLYI